MEKSVAKYKGEVRVYAITSAPDAYQKELAKMQSSVHLPDGFGILDSGDGEKYIGEWKYGKKHGHETYILCDGSPTHKGEFRDDYSWNTRIYMSNGRPDGVVVSEKIHYCVKRPEFCK